jgi:hypothetical protein
MMVAPLKVTWPRDNVGHPIKEKKKKNDYIKLAEAVSMRCEENLSKRERYSNMIMSGLDTR